MSLASDGVAARSYSLRLAGTGDLDAIARLWAEAAPGWGLHPAMVEWFGRNPCGTSLTVVVAYDDGEIAGHILFRPARVRVGGRELLGARAGAVIVSPHLRSWRTVDGKPVHPVFDMYAFAYDALRERGYSLIYMLPDPRWMRLMMMLPKLITGSFPLYSLPLPLAAPLDLGPGYVVRPLDGWDARVDELFESTARRFGCMAARPRDVMRWLVGQGSFDVIGVEHDGRLVGVVASREKGDFQWLIADMLTADDGPSLRATLQAAINHAHAHVGDPTTHKPIRKVALLRPAGFAAVTDSLGFTRDRYDFPLVVSLLDSSLSAADVAPDRWYVSATE